ncbi:alpha/beta hydrolase [Streptomyces sp. NBC_01352]|uniref:alpha/beta fold hydrolase n=1 Tax=Streptomyces sp. NBC_01352 TaxID=2903834 RepID=UPI002E35CD9B|nr:alpha/beta hydrolase [Streptomyces sp. NBC_01352]
MSMESTAARAATEFTSPFVETSLGTVHVRRGGDGPPLMLLHSNGLSWREFEASMEHLARRFHVVAWDMPGQGDSDPVPWDTPIDGYADAASEVIDDLGLDRPFVAGCSVGGFIAASLAARRGEQLAGAFLVEFQFGGEQWFARNWATVETLFAVPTMTPDQVQARLVQPAAEGVAHRWNIDRNKAGARSMMGVMWAIRRYDIRAALEGATVPVDALFGDASPTVAYSAAVTEALGIRGRVQVVPGAGHFVSIDQPDVFADAVAAFAGRSTVAPKP